MYTSVYILFLVLMCVCTHIDVSIECEIDVVGSR